MRPGLKDYILAAFNARPLGMPIPPNWVMLAGFALLGLLNPGFWILGAGVEAAYLLGLAFNRRFQKVVESRFVGQDIHQQQQKINLAINKLSPEDRQRYTDVEKRCQRILQEQRESHGNDLLGVQAEGLSKLLQMYLRLLTAKQTIDRVLRDASGSADVGEPLRARIARIQSRLKKESLSEELARSLAAQADILEQRIEKQNEARSKLAYVEAELSRISEQIELVREQALVTAEPANFSRRIDEVAAGLGDTTRWLSEQSKIYGQVDDLISAPPPLIAEGDTWSSRTRT